MKAYTPSDRYVPWKRNLPADWDFTPLKYLVKINCDVLPENTPARYEFKYIDISSVSPTGRISSPEIVFFDDAPSRARRIVQQGDTIISTVRTYLKAIAFIDQDAQDLICSTGFAVLRPSATVHPKFLFYWIRSEHFVDEICARSVGVSYPAINALELGCLPFPTLPFSFQQSIAVYLDEKLAKLDDMMQQASLLLAPVALNSGTLIEYRDTLITAAVTGKINVWEKAA